MSDASRERIHFAYILAIMLAAIIILVTVHWGGVSDLVSYISFALTLSSLILALIAIVYSFVSNGNLLRTLGSLDNVANSLSVSTDSLKSTTDELAQEVERIPPSFQKISGQINETQEILKNIESVSLSASAGSMANQSPEDQTEIVSTESFLANCSLLGILIIHALYLAEKHKIPFDLEDFSKQTGVNFDYTQGFMVALNSARILNYTDRKGIIGSVDIRDDIGSGAAAAIKEAIAKLGSSNKESDVEISEALRDRFEKVEKVLLD